MTDAAWPAGRPLLEVRALTCVHRPGLPDEVTALRGFELVLLPGELVALVGSGGSGKTSLLRVLAGLDRPSAGAVLVGGLDLARSTASERDQYRRRLVGYVPEQPESCLWPFLTALEHVQAPLLLERQRAGARVTWAVELLASLGLEGRLGQRPAKLTGGERLRLALALALANQPSLLLVDEPAGELDRDTARAVLHDLESLLRRLGAAAVIASRSQDVAPYVDRVVWVSSATTALPRGTANGA